MGIDMTDIRRICMDIGEYAVPFPLKVGLTYFIAFTSEGLALPNLAPTAPWAT